MEVWLDFETPLASLSKKIEELRELSREKGLELGDEIANLEKKLLAEKKKIYTSLTPWQKVQVARHLARPSSLEYIKEICEDFIELHGDRRFKDDPAIVAGVGRINSYRVVLIGHQKGRETQENLRRNFGMAHPEGYRKALRVMKLAEKFSLPVITLIDTPGAYPGVGAEERGQAEAIAENLYEMAQLRVPIIAVIIGEGGSGGALGIGVGDKILMFEHAVYSVISPEGCAAILWKDKARAAEAADVLALTAAELRKLELIDEIIPEPLGGAHREPKKAACSLKKALLRHLNKLTKVNIEKLLAQRYQKLREVKVGLKEEEFKNKKGE
jgi:acetyl-CoA carboxylase carboxyl transferase subunit alpha